MTGRCQFGKKITFWNVEDKKVISFFFFFGKKAKGLKPFLLFT